MDDQDLLFPSLPAGKKWGGKDGKEIVFMKLSEAPTFPPIRVGLKVKTPMGEGTINYVRLDPFSNYTKVFAASVRLAGQLNGTMFAADKVEILEDL
jgi:hypothetical protein